MIFPFLRGFMSPRAAPAAWFLLAINLFVFITTLPAYESAQRRMEAIIEDPEFLSAQGGAFADMVAREPHLFHSASLEKMKDRVQLGDLEARELMGSLALRNPQFVAHADKYEFEGDEVALAAWKGRFRQLRQLQDEHPSYRWGLSHMNASSKNWITYQFAHSGFMHLAMNMAFLLIFGCFMETRVGSALVVIGYLGSGLAGAFAFTRLTGLTASPLVGASASVSGLGALTAFHLWRERVPYFFMAFPRPGYVGFAPFPAWAILALFAVPDLGGYVSSLPDVSSVAYSAHLGGAVWGALMALALKLGWLAEDPFDPAVGWRLFEDLE